MYGVFALMLDVAVGENDFQGLRNGGSDNLRWLCAPSRPPPGVGSPSRAPPARPTFAVRTRAHGLSGKAAAPSPPLHSPPRPRSPPPPPSPPPPSHPHPPPCSPRTPLLSLLLPRPRGAGRSRRLAMGLAGCAPAAGLRFRAPTRKSPGSCPTASARSGRRGRAGRAGPGGASCASGATASSTTTGASRTRNCG